MISQRAGLHGNRGVVDQVLEDVQLVRLAVAQPGRALDAEHLLAEADGIVPVLAERVLDELGELQRVSLGLHVADKAAELTVHASDSLA